MKRLIFLMAVCGLSTIANAQESFYISVNAYLRTDIYKVTDNGDDIKPVSRGATMAGITVGRQLGRFSVETGLYKTSYNGMSVPFRTVVSSDNRLIIEKQFVLPLLVRYDLLRFAYRPQRQLIISVMGGVNLAHQHSATYPGLKGIPSRFYILSAARDTVISARSTFYYESNYIVLPVVGATLSIPLKRQLAVLVQANYTYKNIAGSKAIVRSETNYNLGNNSPTYHATVVNNGQAYNIGIGLSYVFD